jgi:sialate O-acetylesterase
MSSIKVLMLLLILFITSNAFAAIKLPGLVADNMVLQRDTKVLIWGWGDPGEKVQVFFKGKTYKTKTAADGKWLIRLNKHEAGGPYEMDIKGIANNIQIKNILIGDVWLCGGQSNMALDFNNAGVRALYAKEIAVSANDSIRQVIVNRTYGSAPANGYKTSGWRMASPKTLPSFSAAAYFFALNLFQKYHIPIGLINSSYGGTVAEAWTSENGLKELPQFNKDIQFLKDTAALNTKIRTAKNDFDLWDKNNGQGDKGYDAAHKATWAAVDFDDSQWKTMTEPGFWDKQGFPNTYGTIWFRKEINIPETWTGKSAVLKLGQIDDADITYFNGAEIGKTINRDFKRQYNVAASLIKPDKNIITIRITNYNGTGGMFPEDTLQLISGASTLLLNGDWKYEQGVKMSVKPGLYDAKNLPTALYNAMIAPLIPYNFKGVIWYQGEYNTHKAYEYRKLFPALIKDWRLQWKQDNFPFIYVQLPNFQPVIDPPAENEWAELREAQSMALAQPNTAMAVTIDVGGLELHPLDKKDVGDRLALAARKLVYGEKKLVASGPVYKSMKIEGDKIILTFDDGGSKLINKGGNDLKYFAIAGDDKKFVWAKATINGNTVEVFNQQIAKPVAVRYAWAGNPEGCNLYNEAGLPASPFRTDDWPGITLANK